MQCLSDEFFGFVSQLVLILLDGLIIMETPVNLIKITSGVRTGNLSLALNIKEAIKLIKEQEMSVHRNGNLVTNRVLMFLTILKEIAVFAVKTQSLLFGTKKNSTGKTNFRQVCFFFSLQERLRVHFQVALIHLDGQITMEKIVHHIKAKGGVKTESLLMAINGLEVTR